ncbi:glycine zipper 2TM domain-containing protein [Cupriavidus taiwanensis]|uniref:glycine zipper 2TM domain-containing protein n=1 Tax=Cupriavidus taiwanensis TaxID=164546 RepID=UPI00253FED1F|nr:glycine zipper 2TM domain-containing protein [Cupriavidus taiwanensis]MDK3022873.1 glycine zipper 2TM domain-containing protein [Cupriavidus taiwanensis]
MFKRFFLLFLCCAIFTGCAAQPTSPNTYRGSEALRRGGAEAVTVLRVRPVTIVDSDGLMSANTGVPGVLGAVVGAVLGARVIGNGNGRYLAGALSGTVSAVIAQTAANHLGRRDGVEVIVRTDNGRQIVVTQDADQQFVTGEQLYLVSSAGGYRLTR